MTYLGLNLAAADRLADLLARWPADVDGVEYFMRTAESLAELDAGLTGSLTSISNAGRSMAGALRQAIDTATSFRIDPRLALFVDQPVGSRYDPTTANQALASGETYRQIEIGNEIDSLSSQLDNVPPARREQIEQQIAALRAEHRAIDPPTKGDAGGTLSAEVRTPFAPLGSTPFALGAGIIAHALADTGDEDEVHVDEFQAIFHNNGKVTLVLPGVVDLSKPDYGLDEVHNSARDLDQHAVPSSLNSEIDSNVYAQLIVEWIETQIANGVIQPGTEILIVGHSYGADTAVDLASDPYVNGELVNITHVIPAAYHTEPQLNDVVNGTQIGVLQNIYDLPVLAEGIGGDLTGLGLGLISPITDHEPMGGEGSGLAGLTRPLVEAGEGLLSLGALGVNAVGDTVDLLSGNPVLPSQPTVPNLPTDIEILGDVVHVVPGQGFIAEFEGGFEGFGHHQNNYIDYIESHDLPPVVTTMLTDIGNAGYGEPGVSLAIDISVPDAPPPPPAPTPTRTPQPLPPVDIGNPLTVFEPALTPLEPLLEPFAGIFPEPGE